VKAPIRFGVFPRRAGPDRYARLFGRLYPISGGVDIPTLVQHVTGPNTGGGNTIGMLFMHLPNPTLAGNCLILAIQQSTLYTTVPSDISPGTWVAGPTGTDSNFNIVRMFYALNVVAGLSDISVNTRDAGVGNVSAVLSEWYNIATSSAADGSAGASAQGPTIATGAFSTAVDGDLIYQVALCDGQARTGDQPLLSSVTKGSGFTLAGADLLDGNAAQYTVQTTAGSINPTMTVSGIDFYNTVAIALKSAPAGTAPATGIRIVHVQSINAFRNNGGTTIPLQFPCTGNLILVMWSGFRTGVGSVDCTGVADGTNTYVATGAAHANEQAGATRIYYASNATTSPDLALTLTLAAQQEHSNGTLYDVASAATTDTFDGADVVGDGVQSVTGNLETISVTPESPHGLVVGIVAVDLHTISGAVGAGYWFDSMTYPGADGAKNFYEDQGSVHVYNVDTGLLVFVFSTQNNPGGVDDWTARAAAFKGVPFPTITQQPGRQAVFTSLPATFVVAATTSGGPLTYQWQDNSSGPFANIGGATSSNYVTVPTTAAMDGRRYRCTVSDDNGSVRSSEAELRVIEIRASYVDFPKPKLRREN
jgi:hypothetical protein